MDHDISAFTHVAQALRALRVLRIRAPRGHSEIWWELVTSEGTVRGESLYDAVKRLQAAQEAHEVSDKKSTKED